MRKQVLFLLILICAHLCSRAQYFDWVETYTGSDMSDASNTNRIRQSIVDQQGNVYFSGGCAVDATMDGVDLLPIEPRGSGWNKTCGIIGKVSPEGELIWSKIVYANDFNHWGGKIQLIGDTAISYYFTVKKPFANTPNMPLAGMSCLYYLDTLYCRYVGDSICYNGYCLESFGLFSSPSASAFVLFDLDGNIIEQHWMQVSMLDKDGVPFNRLDVSPNYTMGDSTCILTNQISDMWASSVVVDNNNTITIVRSMNEFFNHHDTTMGMTRIDIQSPEVGGLRFYVDGKRYFDVPLPDVRPSAGMHNYQILKFSPHFEELLASQFLFEPTPEHLDTISSQVVINALKCDSHNNVFLSGYSITDVPFIRSGDSVSLTIGGSDSLDLLFRCFDRSRGFLIKYDSALNPLYLKQLDRVTDDIPTSDDYYKEFLWPMEFDDTGNIVIFEGARALYDTVNTHYYYDSTDVTARSSVMLRIDPEDGRLISKGKEIKAEVVTAGGSSSADIVDFVAKNNRVIWQVKYRWWLDFAGERYEKAEATQWGMGFAVWDYDGNELCFVDYGTNGDSRHVTSSACLVDSVLYLTGMLASGGAQFGDVTVYNSGSSQSFIARYVDTAFMHPYVHHGDLQDIQLVVRGGEPVATVYPNPCAQRVTVDWDGDEPPVAATVTDITGRTYSVALAAAGAGHSDSGAKTTGRYTIDFSSLPAANYLLTLTTPSGHRVTTRLLKR